MTHHLTRVMAYLTAVLALAFSGLSTAQQPNVVVLVVDDAGFSDFGAYGRLLWTPMPRRPGFRSECPY